MNAPKPHGRNIIKDRIGYLLKHGTDDETKLTHNMSNLSLSRLATACQ